MAPKAGMLRQNRPTKMMHNGKEDANVRLGGAM
jgi:hypothetical protein